MELTLASTLDALTRDRLFDLARVFGLRLTPRTLPKRDAVLAVSRFFDNRPSFELLDELSPDELLRVAASHDVPVEGRVRRNLVDGVAAALGLRRDATGEGITPYGDDLPPAGAVVLARGASVDGGVIGAR